MKNTIFYLFIFLALGACSDDDGMDIITDELSFLTADYDPFEFCIESVVQLNGTITDFEICADAQNGTLSELSSSTLCGLYTPEAGFRGADEFCIVAIDENGLFDTTIVTINVLPRLVLVHNEGAFLQNNGEITSYDPVQNESNNTLTGSIGDIVQDAILVEDVLDEDVLVASVNNSNQIVVINLSDYSVRSTIEINQPRYIQESPLTPGIIYVSSLDSTLYEIDLEDNFITQSVKQPVGVEDFVIIGPLLLGAERYSNFIHRFSLGGLSYID